MPQRAGSSRFNWQNLALGCAVLLLLALAVWLLSRIPGQVQILGFFSARVEATLPAAAPASEHPTPTLLASLQPAGQSSPAPATAAPVARTTATLPPAGSSNSWQKLSDFYPFTPLAITALAIDPRNPAVILAGTYGGGIYRSTDGGQTWTPSSAGLGSGAVGSLVLHPLDSQRVYAGLVEQGGVYRSNDGGRSWALASTGLALGMNWNYTALLAIAPSEPELLYFSATNNGVYRSLDGGARWDLRSLDCPQVTALLVDPLDADHLYAPNRFNGRPDCPPGIYESQDGAQTWQQLAPELLSGGETWWLALDPRQPGRMVASGGSGTFLTIDADRSWKQVFAACDCLFGDPYSGDYYCQQDTQLWVSTAGGQSWERSGAIAPRRWPWYSPFGFRASPGRLYLGDQAVLASQDRGQSWQNLGRLGAGRARLVIDPADSQRLFLVTLDKPGRILRSPDGGKRWQVVLENIEPGGRLVFDSVGALIYPNPASGGSPLLRSTDGGTTWQPFGQGYPVNSARQLLPDPADPGRLWLVGECGGGIGLSEDGGLTFVPAPGSPENVCQPLLLSDATGQRLYLVAWGNSYRSEDGGESWETLAPLSGYFHAAALDPFDANGLYLASTHLGVLKTTDGGQTWQKVNRGLPGLGVNDLLADPAQPGTLYAAVAGGVYVTYDGGAAWQPLAGGLGPNPLVYSLALDPADSSLLYAFTPDGLFRLKIKSP